MCILSGTLAAQGPFPSARPACAGEGGCVEGANSTLPTRPVVHLVLMEKESPFLYLLLA